MTKKVPFDQGPFLSAAFICERILQETDGVKSAIRIMDRITRTAVGDAPPEDMEPFEYSLTLFIRLKSGRARGAYQLRVNLMKPSGESPTPMQQIVYFEGDEDRGADVVVNMQLMLDQVGIHWFQIYLDNQKLTEVPLRVIYMPQVMQIRGPENSSPPNQ